MQNNFLLDLHPPCCICWLNASAAAVLFQDRKRALFKMRVLPLIQQHEHAAAAAAAAAAGRNKTIGRQKVCIMMCVSHNSNRPAAPRISLLFFRCCLAWVAALNLSRTFLTPKSCFSVPMARPLVWCAQEKEPR